MIQSFLNDLENLEKEYCKCYALSVSQTLKDTIKIFYDYCEEIDHPLRIPLKYMIENNKKPRSWYQPNLFYWTNEGNLYWEPPNDVFCKMSKTLYCVGTWEYCLISLKNALI